MSEMSIPTPRLRADLEFHCGPVSDDGSQTWNVFDPVTGIYRKLGWAESLVLQGLSKAKTLSELLINLRVETTLDLTEKELTDFIKHAASEQLLETVHVSPVENLMELHDKKHPGVFSWLMNNYLYIRLPLFHPDAFLERTLPRVRVFFSNIALTIYAALFLTGMLMVISQAESYWRTFMHFFNLQGAVLYVMALLALKATHELAHAYTAKALGVRVPTMGIALMVFAPVAFCDVTGAWALKSRKQRLMISGAGIIAELIIAGIALFGWAVSAPGVFNSLCFILSSVTLLSTVVVNLNPAMRFDGYYILSDLIRVDNLRKHGALILQNWVRSFLFGIFNETYSCQFSKAKRIGLLVYAIFSWFYRITLYIGIAVIVYYKFTKILGILLFSVEIYVFMIKPLCLEISALTKLKQHMSFNKNRRNCCIGLIVILMWFTLPLPRYRSIPAIVLPEQEQTLYIPATGIVAQLSAYEGKPVIKGDVLFRIISEDIQAEAKLVGNEIAILERQILLTTSNENMRSSLNQFRKERDFLNARLQTLHQQESSNTVLAANSGNIYEWNQLVKNGQAMPKGSVVGKVAGESGAVVVAYLHEDYAGSLTEGQKISFSRVDGALSVTVKVQSIQALRSNILKYPALSSSHGGELPVIGEKNLVGSYYKVRALSESANRLPYGMTGRVFMWTPPRSIVYDVVMRVFRTLIRESGF